MAEQDFSVFEQVLELRSSWFGLDDIHGHRNDPGAHAVGLWGEIGVLRWFEANEVPIEWTGREDDALPDFIACGRIGIETKAQRPDNWTSELATTVQKRSLANWLKKDGNKYVIWTVCDDPREEGVHAVRLMGWDAIATVRQSETKMIRGTQQYQTYPNHKRYLKSLLSGLGAECHGS